MSSVPLSLRRPQGCDRSTYREPTPDFGPDPDAEASSSARLSAALQLPQPRLCSVAGLTGRPAVPTLHLPAPTQATASSGSSSLPAFAREGKDHCAMSSLSSSCSTTTEAPSRLEEVTFSSAPAPKVNWNEVFAETLQRQQHVAAQATHEPQRAPPMPREECSQIFSASLRGTVEPMTSLSGESQAAKRPLSAQRVRPKGHLDALLEAAMAAAEPITPQISYRNPHSQSSSAPAKRTWHDDTNLGEIAGRLSKDAFVPRTTVVRPLSEIFDRLSGRPAKLVQKHPQEEPVCKEEKHQPGEKYRQDFEGISSKDKHIDVQQKLQEPVFSKPRPAQLKPGQLLLNNAFHVSQDSSEVPSLPAPSSPYEKAQEELTLEVLPKAVSDVSLSSPHDEPALSSQEPSPSDDEREAEEGVRQASAAVAAAEEALKLQFEVLSAAKSQMAYFLTPEAECRTLPSAASTPTGKQNKMLPSFQEFRNSEATNERCSKVAEGSTVQSTNEAEKSSRSIQAWQDLALAVLQKLHVSSTAEKAAAAAEARAVAQAKTAATSRRIQAWQHVAKALLQEIHVSLTAEKAAAAAEARAVAQAKTAAAEKANAAEAVAVAAEAAEVAAAEEPSAKVAVEATHAMVESLPSLVALLETLADRDDHAFVHSSKNLNSQLEAMEIAVAKADATLFSANPQLESEDKDSELQDEELGSKMYTQRAPPKPTQPPEPSTPALSSKSSTVAVPSTPSTVPFPSTPSTMPLPLHQQDGGTDNTDVQSVVTTLTNPLKSRAPSEGGRSHATEGGPTVPRSRSRADSEISELSFSAYSTFTDRTAATAAADSKRGKPSVVLPEPKRSSGDQEAVASTAALAAEFTNAECALCGKAYASQPGNCFCTDCNMRMDLLEASSQSSDSSSEEPVLRPPKLPGAPSRKPAPMVSPRQSSRVSTPAGSQRGSIFSTPAGSQRGSGVSTPAGSQRGSRVSTPAGSRRSSRPTSGGRGGSRSSSNRRSRSSSSSEGGPDTRDGQACVLCGKRFTFEDNAQSSVLCTGCLAGN